MLKYIDDNLWIRPYILKHEIKFDDYDDIFVWMYVCPLKFSLNVKSGISNIDIESWNNKLNNLSTAQLENTTFPEYRIISFQVLISSPCNRVFYGLNQNLILFFVCALNWSDNQQISFSPQYD